MKRLLVTWIGLLALLGTAVNAYVGPDSALAARAVLVIRANSAGVQNLGGFHPIRNPTVRAAVNAYGRPSSRQPRYGGGGCRISWKKLGLEMTFAYYGGGGKRAACHRGIAKIGLIEGSQANRWRTSRGLGIGDSLEQLEQQHPNAVEWEGDYWLAVGYSPIGEGSSYPVLAATLRSEKVSRFEVMMSPGYD